MNKEVTGESVTKRGSSWHGRSHPAQTMSTPAAATSRDAAATATATATAPAPAPALLRPKSLAASGRAGDPSHRNSITKPSLPMKPAHLTDLVVKGHKRQGSGGVGTVKPPTPAKPKNLEKRLSVGNIKVPANLKAVTPPAASPATPPATLAAKRAAAQAVEPTIGNGGGPAASSSQDARRLSQPQPQLGRIPLPKASPEHRRKGEQQQQKCAGNHQQQHQQQQQQQQQQHQQTEQAAVAEQAAHQAAEEAEQAAAAETARKAAVVAAEEEQAAATAAAAEAALKAAGELALESAAKPDTATDDPAAPPAAPEAAMGAVLPEGTTEMEAVAPDKSRTGADASLSLPAGTESGDDLVATESGDDQLYELDSGEPAVEIDGEVYVVLYEVMAEFDFEAEEEGELVFRAGNAILVIDDADELWWFGAHAGKAGYFPKKFAQRMAQSEAEGANPGASQPTTASQGAVTVTTEGRDLTSPQAAAATDPVDEDGNPLYGNAAAIRKQAQMHPQLAPSFSRGGKPLSRPQSVRLSSHPGSPPKATEDAVEFDEEVRDRAYCAIPYLCRAASLPNPLSSIPFRSLFHAPARCSPRLALLDSVRSDACSSQCRFA